jgi:16S rRNA (uracil1498-N3)-methyltransferase
MATPRHSGFRARFFVSEEPVVGAETVLSVEDSHHAGRVLRLRVGDLCEVVSPERRAFVAHVTSVGAAVRVMVQEELRSTEAGAAYCVAVGLVQALARPAAVDFTVEKGTEVGADFFILVQSHGSPGGDGKDLSAKLQRWGRIALEAAKQSKQTRVPWVECVSSVRDGLKRAAELGCVSVVLDPAAETPLFDVVTGLASTVAGAQKPALWIGPEGGWSEEELEAFAAAGIPAAKLGRSVLRTETAGPVAAAVTRLALGDW